MNEQELYLILLLFDLIFYTTTGNLEVIKILTENSADVNAKDDKNKTALFYARREGT